MTTQAIIIETHGAVGLVRLNRPEALNALNSQLLGELSQALQQFDQDDKIGAMVVTGSAKAFAAGADIKEMQAKTSAGAFQEDFAFTGWGIDKIMRCRKPIIAAVAGYALGGGCELAMVCDFILAADNAKFGQPEINLGTIPGIGGSQRLTRLVGKSKAMEMVLTGRMMDAAEAERCGLASRVIEADKLVEEALAVAAKIASHSQFAVKMAKEVVNAAYETHLAEGLRLERQMFYASFSSEDQKEGMQAFIEKRKANWQHR